MNTHDHYRAGERIRSNISTYDGYDGAGDDPEATAQELALTVQKSAPGADVYTSTRVPEPSA